MAGREDRIDAFLDALELSIQAMDGQHTIDTLFLGGGTPSFLDAAQLARLGEILFAKFRLSEAAEFTAECNPSDINPDRIRGFQELGVNRISLGVQSFSQSKLTVLERDHSPRQAVEAFELSMKAIGNVSMDLIFAAPDESVADWTRDLATALELSPTHLSTYELTWEKGTQFWNRLSKGHLVEASELIREQMYTHAIEACRRAGLNQYEVSSFAVAGKRCQHNLAYWLGNPWFAFGPSAASYIDNVRTTMHPSPTTWIKRTIAGESAVYQSERLTPTQAALERLVFGIRMVDGVDVTVLTEVSGVDITSKTSELISEFQQAGLMESSQGMVRLTPQGRLLADGISEKLLGLQ